MLVRGVALELAGADFHKSYARAVVGIHVGMDFEDEARKAGFVGIDGALDCLNGFGRGGNLHETVK